MRLDLCGVCNEEVPMEHASMARMEEEGITVYHAKCEGQIPKEPCEDCGKHRMFCSECAEYGF